MAALLKQLGRLLIATVVCTLLITGFVEVFMPKMMQYTNEKTLSKLEAVQLEEPTVVYLSATENAGPSTTLSYVLGRLAAENTTGQLDLQYWQTVQLEIGRVFTYKEINNTFIQQEFDGQEAGTWMFVFTSSNASEPNQSFKVKAKLYLN